MKNLGNFKSDDDVVTKENLNFMPISRIMSRADANEMLESGIYLMDMWTGVTRDGLNLPQKSPSVLYAIRFDTNNIVQIWIPRDVDTQSIYKRKIELPGKFGEWKEV